MSAFPSSHVPPGPADTRYPTHILARLAVAKAAAELSDAAAKLVDMSDRPSATTEQCKRIVRQAQDLMELAAIRDYEDHSRSDESGSWPNSLDPQWQSVVQRWYQDIGRPWEPDPTEVSNSPGVVRVRSTLPSGLDNPTSTAAALDDWLTRRMFRKATTAVSGALRQHDIESERLSISRHDHFLRGTNETQAEVEAHQKRIERFNKKANRINVRGFLEYEGLPENDENHLVSRFWDQILDDVVCQHRHLRKELAGTQLYRADKDTVVIGSVLADRANLYYTLAEAFEESICTATGIATIRVRVATQATAERLEKERDGR